MFTRARLAFGLAVLAASFGLAATAAAQPLRSDAGGSATLGAQVLSQLNAIRAQRGLVPLRVAPALSAAAALHSREMTHDGYFDHNSADGSPFWKRLERFYPSGKAQFWSVGENLLWESPGIDAGATGVRVLERFSFAEVPSGRADDVVRQVAGKRVRGTELKVEVAGR